MLLFTPMLRYLCSPVFIWLVELLSLHVIDLLIFMHIFCPRNSQNHLV